MSDVIGRLIGIGVMLALIALAVTLGLMLTGQSSAAIAASNLSSVVSTVEETYAGQPSFNGLTNSVATAAGVFPQSMVSGSGSTASVHDKWGGAVTIQADSSNSSEFDLNYAQVPQKACIKLATTLGSSAKLRSLSINGTSQTLPPTVSNATTDCTSTTANTLAWTVAL